MASSDEFALEFGKPAGRLSTLLHSLELYCAAASRAFGKDSGKRPDKSHGVGNRFGGVLMRDVGARAGLIVGDGFQIIGAAEKGAKVDVEARIVFHEARKFSLKTLECFLKTRSCVSKIRA